MDKLGFMKSLRSSVDRVLDAGVVSAEYLRHSGRALRNSDGCSRAG